MAIGILIKIFTILTLASSVQAQDQEDPDHIEFPKGKYLEIGASGGVILPFGVFGVRSDYPAWGLRFGHALRIWRMDWSAYFANAEGVQFNTGSISFGGTIDLYDMRLALFTGPDVHYYKPKPTATRTYNYVLTTGWHVGLSPIFPITESWFLRADFKLNFSPGTTLYAGIGFAYLIPEGSNDNSGQGAP